MIPVGDACTCAGSVFEVADAILVHTDRHAFAIGLNASVQTGFLLPAIEPMLPYSPVLAGGAVDTFEKGDSRAYT